MDDTTTGSFPAGAAGAPQSNFNPFDSSQGAPPAPTTVDGQPREVPNEPALHRQAEPVRQEPVARVAPVAPVAKAPVQQQAPVAPVTNAPVVMSDAQLEKLAQSLRPQAAPTQQPQTKPQMTDEEFAKAFNIHKTTAEEYEAIIGIKPDSPARIAALDATLQAVSRQSVTLARAMVDQAKQELLGQIQPAREAMLQQQGREYHAQFVASNPDLKDYTPLLQEIVASTKAKIDSGAMPNFRSPAEAAVFVANTARKLLNIQAPQPGVQPAQSQQQPPSRQQGGSRSMSTTSMGGRTGSNGGATPVQTLAEKFFGGTENT